MVHDWKSVTHKETYLTKILYNEYLVMGIMES